MSAFRLNFLRAVYLLVAVGNAVFIWPRLIGSGTELEHMRGVVHALLGALGLLSFLGLRYPLAMLPLLVFELTWKIIWVGVIAVPLLAAGRLSPAIEESLAECLLGIVIIPLAIPWKYLWRQYAATPGDPWRRPA